MTSKPLYHLVVDVDDNYHVCYATEDLGVAMTQAVGGLHLYVPFIEDDEEDEPAMTVFLRGGREMKVPYDLELMAFEFEGTCIQNPFVSECSRFPASPTYYGFEVYDTGGRCYAYKRDMPNGNYLLLTTDEGLLPDETDDAETAIMGLYTNDGEQIAQINVADIPMEG